MASFSSGVFTPDRLTGQTLVRGAVLGKITDAILAQDIDATGADMEAMAYFTGRFNSAAQLRGRQGRGAAGNIRAAGATLTNRPKFPCARYRACASWR